MKGELEKGIARNETRLATMTEIQATHGRSDYYSGSGNGDADTERRDLEGEFKHRENCRSRGNEEGWIRFMVLTFFSFNHTPLLVVKYFSACIQYTNFTILFFYSSFQWIFLCISILEVAGIN